MANEWRVTSVGVEVLHANVPGTARVISVGVEVLHANVPGTARVTMVGVEVMYGTGSLPPSDTRRRQMIFVN